MVGSCCLQITNMKDQEEYMDIIDTIIRFAHCEISKIKRGEESPWRINLLEQTILTEMNELSQYMLQGKLFLKYGKEQRQLVSAYMVIDSFDYGKTPLGIQILRLQRKIYSQG